jgi:hypothetical protein
MFVHIHTQTYVCSVLSGLSIENKRISACNSRPHPCSCLSFLRFECFFSLSITADTIPWLFIYMCTRYRRRRRQLHAHTRTSTLFAPCILFSLHKFGVCWTCARIFRMCLFGVSPLQVEKKKNTQRYHTNVQKKRKWSLFYGSGCFSAVQAERPSLPFQQRGFVCSCVGLLFAVSHLCISFLLCVL